MADILRAMVVDEQNAVVLEIVVGVDSDKLFLIGGH
jgi:hypothetical protein